MAYPLEYPSDIPSGLVPSLCTGCKRLWWIEPPPSAVDHCMCCQGKLRFLIRLATPLKTNVNLCKHKGCKLSAGYGGEYCDEHL